MRKILTYFCAAVFALFAVCPRTGVLASAETTDEKAKSVEECVTAMETELNGLGTDVVSELIKQRAHYERLAAETPATDGARLSQLEELILMTEDLIFQYEERANGKKGWLKDNFMYVQAVASVVAYFIGNEYYLAAELLTHMQYNRELNSLYSPINDGYIPQASAFTAIKNGEEDSGSSRFSKFGTASDMDLFYSLHQFSYAKFDGGKTVVLYDRYDYAPDGKFELFDNIPIQVMYAAQEAGVLTPYYTFVEVQDAEGVFSGEDGSYNRISRIDGEYHLFKSGCADKCELFSCEYARESVEIEHADGNLDGFCDDCNAITPLPEIPENSESPETIKPSDTPESPSEKKNVFNTVKESVGALWGKVQDFMDGTVDDVQENLGSCDGSVSGVSYLSAIGLGAVLWRKKKKDGKR